MSNGENNRLPLYAQVENVIIDPHCHGSLSPGTRLPSEDSLVQEYAVKPDNHSRSDSKLVQRGSG